MVWSIFLVTLGHLSWLCSLPRCCLLPSLLVRGGSRGYSFDVVRTLFSSSWNTSVLSTIFWLPIQNTALWELLWENYLRFRSFTMWQQLLWEFNNIHIQNVVPLLLSLLWVQTYHSLFTHTSSASSILHRLLTERSNTLEGVKEFVSVSYPLLPFLCC